MAQESLINIYEHELLSAKYLFKKEKTKPWMIYDIYNMIYLSKIHMFYWLIYLPVMNLR